MGLKSASMLQHLNNYVAGEVNVVFAKISLSLTFIVVHKVQQLRDCYLDFWYRINFAS